MELCRAYLCSTDGRGSYERRNEARMIDVLLTTFVDHGVTPSSLTTRLTLLVHPRPCRLP